MNSPAHDTALYLTAFSAFGSFGGVADWPVYVGREPLEPEDVVTCYDTGGAPGPLIDLRKPTVQVRLRANSYNAGWQKINAAYEALVQPIAEAAPDVLILGWVPISEVAYIGRDDHDRALFTVNFEVMRDGATA
ncbi:MAG: hypothetical protein CMK96_05525 [Pseudomonas sp.]|nr:hypothetical protein [Pseudomonas sp.]QDP67245.1 MAG: hypothetical protein GOVbin7368_36 [Prokaryotic dsDNA virus sp.]|tara:strand:+ start:19838 stop:20239 length:402 start_codon:yes stop_codon:yes gene_type:complete